MKISALCSISIGLTLVMLMSGLVATPVQAAVAGTGMNWAILISGGVDTANNYARYWNDISEMYEILTSTYGYVADHVFVLYADGNPPTAANCHNPEDVVNYPTNIIDFAATRHNLSLVASAIADSGSPSDTLFVFTSDHGAPDGSICLWGRTFWGNPITISPAAFASSDYIGKITQYSWRAFEMEQCYSGAFVSALSGLHTALATACRANEPSFGGLPPHEGYDEFCFYFGAALKGAEPTSVGGTPVDADVNNDGEVSFMEAFNYAQSHDQRAEEHPQYDDNGDGISHEGQMPAGGDGSLGSEVFIGIGVTGLVGDRATGYPLPYSMVTVTGQVIKEVEANSGGQYTVTLRPGIYNITASHDTFSPLTYYNVAVEEGGYATVNFLLSRQFPGPIPMVQLP